MSTDKLSYTAPKGLLLPEDGDSEEKPLHVAEKNDYQSQKFYRSIQMDVHTYQERMLEMAKTRQTKESEQTDVQSIESRKRKRSDDSDDENQPRIKNSESKDSSNSKESKSKESKESLRQTKVKFALATDNQSETIETHNSDLENGKDLTLVSNSQVFPIVNGLELTDEILSKILPHGYVKAAVPSEFSQNADIEVYSIPEAKSSALLVNDILPEYDGIAMRRVDVKYFSSLVNFDPNALDSEEKKNLRTLELLFKIKNGSANIRKKATRSLLSIAKEVGPKTILSVALPLLLESALDEQDRHILTKLIGRLLYPWEAAIKPYTHKLITAIAPLLIDEDLTLRLEAKEVVANIARAAGLANIVSSLRPDLDHPEEYVRNLTARVFAVVATTLGLLKVLPFVKAAIRSKKSWHARHTGIRIVHHVCIMQGGGNGALLLPHLPQLVEVLLLGLSDELVQVRTATATTMAQLAEAVHPYGIEAFEQILEPAWSGIKQHRGRSLAAFLRCIGSLIPLMDHNPQFSEYCNYYTRELMLVMAREFTSPDDDMRRTLLRILASIPLSKVLFPDYKRKIYAPFFSSFYTRRVALDSSQVSKLVVEASMRLAQRLDFSSFAEKLIPFTKDENENLRRMACSTIFRILSVSPELIVDLDGSLDSRLVDGVLFAFQEQTTPHFVYLLAFSTLCKVLGLRLEPHVALIVSTMLYRLKSSDSAVRQQAADLIAAIASVLFLCSHGNSSMMYKLILFLYELLGEVYPEVLGSIVGALYGCINSLDRDSLLGLQNPSINILLPTLTPILKNRQEKVQENCIKLVGLIAKKNSETINAKEWMRVCFDLLNMLKSQRKKIRIAANATFGDISRTIGPQDILSMLLNNLKVQERQLRVCTAVAIGIVADICSPFTVLPALMNEYRFPDKNVQNGVLKALSFLFEYLDGKTSKDYLFAITPLLQDALTDRDQVHRQIAATVVRHLALNCYGHTHGDYSDIFIHFLNLVLPNIYVTSPHVIIRILESLDALRLVLGPGQFFNYIWLGLFHAARKVRGPFWKVYNAAYVQNSDNLVPYYPRILFETGADENENDEIPSSSILSEMDIWM